MLRSKMPFTRNATLFGLVLLALIAGAVFLTGYNTKKPPNEANVSPTTASTTDPTTGWQVFVDTEQGYSVKYPES